MTPEHAKELSLKKALVRLEAAKTDAQVLDHRVRQEIETRGVVTLVMCTMAFDGGQENLIPYRCQARLGNKDELIDWAARWATGHAAERGCNRIWGMLLLWKDWIADDSGLRTSAGTFELKPPTLGNIDATKEYFTKVLDSVVGWPDGIPKSTDLEFWSHNK